MDTIGKPQDFMKNHRKEILRAFKDASYMYFIVWLVLFIAIWCNVYVDVDKEMKASAKARPIKELCELVVQGVPLTYDEIGMLEGLSGSRVRYIVKQAMLKLRFNSSLRSLSS